MMWDDEERIIAALEAKGRTVAANIHRALAEGIEARRVETRSKAPREARKPGAKHPPKLSGGQTNA